MFGAFVGAAVGAFLAGGGRRVHTIESRTVYRDVDYDKLARKTVDTLFKEAERRLCATSSALLRLPLLRQVLMVDAHGWKSGNAIRNCAIFHELFRKAYSLWYTLSAQDEHDGVSDIDDEIEALKLQLKSPASIEYAQRGGN